MHRPSRSIIPLAALGLVLVLSAGCAGDDPVEETLPTTTTTLPPTTSTAAPTTTTSTTTTTTTLFPTP